MMPGAPVLTSAEGALMETAGGAALLVDPTDAGAMADAIATLAADDALCAALRERGGRRAACYTLPRFSARLAALYDDLIADRR